MTSQVQSPPSLEDEDMLIIDAQQASIPLRPGELWAYRELLYFMVWRQVIVRYKQTAVGVMWALIQPIATMLIMTLVFNEFLQIESGDGTPYPIFVLSALIFWRYFSSALTQGGQSLVSNAHMIGKVYFPRIIVPLAACVSPVVDFLLALLVMLVMMPFFGMMPTLRVVLVPLLLVVTFFTSFSVALWLSALNVRYRDISQVIPFLIQIWMYLVPIMYPISAVSETIRPIYSINPMVGVVEGARWVLLGRDAAPDFTALSIGLGVVIVLFIGGLLFFNRVERSFADIV